MTKMTAALAALLTSGSALAVDALTARVNTDDADRFVAVFEAAKGTPDAAALQAGYLEPGSRGVEIFTPHRIRDAEHLARVVAARSEEYRRGIDVCLPVAKDASDELRATYLALEGLLGSVELPEIYALFGAANSGGTAGPGAQVLGLEVICRIADSEEEIRAILRQFFAHETVHVLQSQPSEAAQEADPLLALALQEGVADFVAWLATGRVPHPERAQWAAQREAQVWADFVADREAVARMPSEDRSDRSKGSAIYRWVGNAGSPPEGWPDELGYWVGMQIAQAYFDAADDKRAAVKELLNADDARVILERSGYAERFGGR